MTTLEGLTFSGGDYTKRVKLQHVAVLVRHSQGSFLFDSGLGKKVDEQVKTDRVRTLESVVLLHRLQQANPQLVIVSAHDASVQDGIGHFPKFVK